MKKSENAHDSLIIVDNLILSSYLCEICVKSDIAPPET